MGPSVPHATLLALQLPCQQTRLCMDVCIDLVASQRLANVSHAIICRVQHCKTFFFSHLSPICFFSAHNQHFKREPIHSIYFALGSTLFRIDVLPRLWHPACPGPSFRRTCWNTMLLEIAPVVATTR